jgi:hypothetical protein
MELIVVDLVKVAHQRKSGRAGKILVTPGVVCRED